MLHISKPVDWEVFSIPPKQPVQYYSILKKKRDFSQLIKQYEAQVFKHGYLHYCSIVPKNISSTLNDKYELIIVFFDENPNTSFLGFRVKVSKETFLHESNSLLLFLKKSKKVVFYLMNNNCIHVQCGKNAWELFYLLYDAYLRQYVLTVIGTNFFFHFVYSYCIKKEILLLETLYKGSKIIRISRKSIYFKIHRKRKISVMDLIHMTLNMPKSKRCVLSFNDKGSILQSDLDDKNFYTSVGSKIHVSKLVLKKFKKHFQNSVPDKTIINPITMEKVQSECNSVYNLQSESLSMHEISEFDTDNKPMSSTTLSLKRKFEEIVNDEDTIQSSPAASKFLKVSDSACHKGVNEDQWKHYTNFKPCAVKSYSAIPCLKYLVPNLLNNGKSLNFINSNSYLFNDHYHTLVQSDILPSVSFDKEINFNTHSDCLTTEETCKIEDHKNLPSSTKNRGIKEVSPAVDGSSVSNQSYKMKTDLTNAEFNISQSTSLNPQHTHENYVLFPQKNPTFYNDFETFSTQSLTTSEKFKTDHFNSDVNFTTAAGEIINISNSALLKAHKLIQNVCDEENQQNFPAEVTHNPNKRKFKKLHNFKNTDLFIKSTTLNMPVDTAHVSPESFKNLKVGEMTSKNLDADPSESITESIGLENFDIPEDVCFSTAAGKSIAVSNTAMQAAQKLFQDVLKEEKISTPQSHSIYANKIFKNPSTFRDIGCPSKKLVAEEIDVDMDNTLVEKLFEDTIFDEKDLETPSVSNIDKNTTAALEPKSDKDLPARKPKKSLGGRMSMRFCSDTL